MSAETVIRVLIDLFSIFGYPDFIHSDRGSQFMSKSVREFLNSNGISQSRTTPYHPIGNGQCERYNGILWKGIKLALADENKDEAHWEKVLPKVLHAQRSLLCTATNATPHDRLFNFPRRSGLGASLPSWLLNPGPVLLRKFQRQNKSEPLVDEVELIEANTHFARVKFANGVEDTVSTRDLAPYPTSETVTNNTENNIEEQNVELPLEAEEDRNSGEGTRRSNRIKKPPNRFY